VADASARFRSDTVRTAGIRRKVTGKSKQEVREKLKALRAEVDSGLKTSAGCTVQQAIDDWLLDGSWRNRYTTNRPLPTIMTRHERDSRRRPRPKRGPCARTARTASQSFSPSEVRRAGGGEAAAQVGRCGEAEAVAQGSEAA
jgi:hypothetical protein